MAKTDYDRNIQIDADQLFAINTLMTAHAGSLMLFPDIASITMEFERYKSLFSSALQSTGNILDVAISALAESEDIFDEGTRDVISHISHLEQDKENGDHTTHGTLATKHSWLRGALGAIGNFVVEQARKASEKVITEISVKTILEYPKLSLSITIFPDKCQANTHRTC
jgi:hypothetical protein